MLHACYTLRLIQHHVVFSEHVYLSPGVTAHELAMVYICSTHCFSQFGNGFLRVHSGQMPLPSPTVYTKRVSLPVALSQLACLHHHSPMSLHFHDHTCNTCEILG